MARENATSKSEPAATRSRTSKPAAASARSKAKAASSSSSRGKGKGKAKAKPAPDPVLTDLLQSSGLSALAPKLAGEEMTFADLAEAWDTSREALLDLLSECRIGGRIMAKDRVKLCSAVAYKCEGGGDHDDEDEDDEDEDEDDVVPPYVGGVGWDKKIFVRKANTVPQNIKVLETRIMEGEVSIDFALWCMRPGGELRRDWPHDMNDHISLLVDFLHVWRARILAGVC